jgi:hypothetical protein
VAENPIDGTPRGGSNENDPRCSSVFRGECFHQGLALECQKVKVIHEQRET